MIGTDGKRAYLRSGFPLPFPDDLLVPALDRFLAAHPREPKRLFCTYTAMMALRRTLAARHDLPEFGEEAVDA